MGRRFLNITKAKYDKPNVTIILNGEKLNSFSLKSVTKQECQHSPLIQYRCRTHSQSNKARERNKRDSNRKGRLQIIVIERRYYPILKRP
jgi:hypothetical protein